MLAKRQLSELVYDAVNLEGILFIDRIDPDKKAKIEQKFQKKAEKKDE